MKQQETAKAGGKEAEGKAGKHNLNWTVHLLAACRKDELEKLEKLQGVPRCVAMYRLAPSLSTEYSQTTPLLLLLLGLTVLAETVLLLF